ncbi:MAG: hypothetical protein WCB15_22045, partial [Desulfobacterales bacterium]
LMNYPAAELRSIKMNFYLINPDAEHRGILLIKIDRIHYFDIRHSIFDIRFFRVSSMIRLATLEPAAALNIEALNG